MKWFILFLVVLVYFSFAQSFNSSFPRIKKLNNGEIKIDQGFSPKESKQSNSIQGVANDGLTIAKVDSLPSHYFFNARDIISYDDDFKCVVESGYGFRVRVKYGMEWEDMLVDISGEKTLLFSGFQDGRIYLETIVFHTLYLHVEVLVSANKGENFSILGGYDVPLESNRWISIVPLIENGKALNLLYSSEGADDSYMVYYQGKDSFLLSGFSSLGVKTVYIDDIAYVLMLSPQGNAFEVSVSNTGWGHINPLTPNYRFAYFENLDQSVTDPVPMIRMNYTDPSVVFNSEGGTIFSFDASALINYKSYRQGLGVAVIDHFLTNTARLVLFDDSKARQYAVDERFLGREGNIGLIINKNNQIFFFLDDGIVYEVQEEIKEKDMISSLNNHQDAIPDEFQLDQNYPNPFNPSTKIKFFTPETGLTSLKVYDLLGREVITLVNKELSAGKHEVSFEASNLASGVYVYTLSVGKYTATKKMTLLRCGSF